MGDVITRFKLETTQYDSKLRDAAKSLKDVSHTASMAGSEFGKFTQKNVEAARSFGNITTSATNAKDKVKELVGAYNDVAKAYNALTKEQQQSDFGKAMSESLTTLQGRIREAKAEMNSTGGILGQLKEKFVINIDALKLFNAGVTAAKATLEVAKDAFFASEANVDEWGRTIDASKSLYEGFLTALNTGDISGYLSRIDSIVKAAREAYNELDRLGSMKTIQAPQISAQTTENERMRMMVQSGHYIAPVDGRRASMQNGQLLTPDQIRRIEQQLQGGMQKVVILVGNEVKQTGRAIDAVYKRQANELGMSLKEFQKGTSSMAEFDKRMEGYNQYQKWRSEHTTIDIQSGRETVARGNPFEQFAKWGVFRVDGERYNDLVRLIQQRDQQASQAYSMQNQMFRTMNRVDGLTVSKIMNGSSSGGSGGRSGSKKTVNTPSIDDFNKQIFKNAGENLKKEIEHINIFEMFKGQAKFDPEDILGSTDKWDAFKNTIIDDTAEIKDAFSNLNEWTKDFNPYKDLIEKENADLKKMVETATLASSALSGIGQAFASIEDPAAKVAGTIMQAIATIAMGYAQATLAAAQTGNPWVWVAFAASGLAQMVSMISTIHSSTGYQNGGVVKGYQHGGVVKGYAGGKPVMGYAGGGTIGSAISGGIVTGSTYSNDQIPIMANAGEVVLNSAQAGVIANRLNSQDRGIHIFGEIEGEKIILAANTTFKRKGEGEIVTW